MTHPPLTVTGSLGILTQFPFTSPERTLAAIFNFQLIATKSRRRNCSNVPLLSMQKCFPFSSKCTRSLENSSAGKPSCSWIYVSALFPASKAGDIIRFRSLVISATPRWICTQFPYWKRGNILENISGIYLLLILQQIHCRKVHIGPIYN